MPVTLSKPGFDQQSFDAFLHARNEPAWLTEQRREAWQVFLEKDWPQRNEEEWIRTDIRLFKLNQYSLPLPLGEGRGEGNEASVRRDVTKFLLCSHSRQPPETRLEVRHRARHPLPA